MSAVGAIDRLLRTKNILEYKGDAVEDARRARKELDTFSLVNEIISTPEKSGWTVGESMRVTYESNKDILSGSIKRNIEKSLGIDKLV